MRGYPDRALQRSREAIELARQAADPFLVAFALSWSATVQMMRRERETAWALEAIALSEEQGFAIPLLVGKVVRAWMCTGERGGDETLAELQQQLTQTATTGTQAAAPQILGTIGDVCLALGRVQEASGYIGAALAVSEATGQPYWDSELHRLKAEVSLQQGDGSEQGVEHLLRRALGTSQRQQARSLELRAAISLARLWQGQGKSPLARSLLTPVYEWFTEGFDTQDLKDAKALLEELA